MFRTQGHLKNHMNKHKTLSSMNCIECGANFNSCYELNKHTLEAHLQKMSNKDTSGTLGSSAKENEEVQLETISDDSCPNTIFDLKADFFSNIMENEVLQSELEWGGYLNDVTTSNYLSIGSVFKQGIIN